MTTEKRGRGRPKGRTPTHTVHTAIDLDVGTALTRFMDEQTYDIKLKSVVERALKLLLTEEGYWPPDKKGHK